MTHSFAGFLLAAVALATTGSANAALIAFAVTLDGAQEVDAGGTPNQGDTDGYGIATLIVDDQSNQITWSIVASNIDLPLAAAHIHEAPAGTNGPVRIAFSAALSGSVIDADAANVLANPTGFYVNLHNALFPAGVIRGQLGQPVAVAPVPLPPAVALLATALGGLVARRHLRGS